MTDILNVMEIERFALHDGPGIRTTVFLKGCPLKCPWCANPESQTSRKLLLYFANKCKHCGACVQACRQGAIGWEAEAPVFIRDSCIGCEACREACLHDAIDFSGRPVSVEAVIAEALRDRDYYEETGGGLTISGGEPFVQFDGMMALLRRAREEGLHTAVETCGQTTADKMREAAQVADMFLFDLKHADAEKLRRVANGDLRVILENLRVALESPAEVIARIPVIPGFNEDALEDILALAAREGVKEAHLLAYHTLGSSKYAQIGLAYPWREYEAMDKEKLRPMAEKAEKLGLTVRIGG